MTFRVVFPRDIVNTHIAACTQALLKHLNSEFSDHHPYSPEFGLTKIEMQKIK
jgi:hypothetical protein